MLKEEIVKYETAKLAHKKGFDGLCDIFYRLDEDEVKLDKLEYWEGVYEGKYRDLTFDTHCYTNRNELEEGYDDTCILAPTLSLLQRWLRDERDMTVNIIPNFTKGFNKYNVGLVYINEKIEIDMGILKDETGYNKTFDSYEKALENGLQKALKIIK